MDLLENTSFDNSHEPIAIVGVGPLRRGVEWETTAIPEIRAQAEALARVRTVGARRAQAVFD
jgi:hypothetical protein